MIKVRYLNLEKDLTISNSELIKGINSLDLDERLEIATGIDLNADSVKDKKILAVKSMNDLIKNIDIGSVPILASYLNTKLVVLEKLASSEMS